MQREKCPNNTRRVTWRPVSLDGLSLSMRMRVLTFFTSRFQYTLKPRSSPYPMFPQKSSPLGSRQPRSRHRGHIASMLMEVTMGSMSLWNGIDYENRAWKQEKKKQLTFYVVTHIVQCNKTKQENGGTLRLYIFLWNITTVVVHFCSCQSMTIYCTYNRTLHHMHLLLKYGSRTEVIHLSPKNIK